VTSLLPATTNTLTFAPGTSLLSSNVNGILSTTSLANLLCNNTLTGIFSFCNGGNSSGANNTLGTNDAFAQIFETNNIERMRILANGNVGIGTIAPTTKLHIKSDTVNDSGLRLEQLNLTTPTTFDSVPLGIDATGKVVVASPLDLYRDRGMPNTLMTLSGVATYSRTNFLNWTSRFLILGGGRGPGTLSTDGYYDIRMPNVGTFIPIVGGATGVTVTPAGINMNSNGWVTLYYILNPTGAGSGSNNFRLVSYQNNFIVPNNWVMVAAFNSESFTLKLVMEQLHLLMQR
jgi:hypothetical protein